MSAREPVFLEVEQLLTMRQFVGLESLSLDAAARILATMTERTLEAGTRLSEGGKPLDAAWFLREGEIAIGDPARASHVATRDPIGLLELLAESPQGLEITCVTEVVVFEIRGEELTALLADDFDGLVGAMRSISGAILSLSEMEPSFAEPPSHRGEVPMSFVDRLLFLRGLSAFTIAGAETTAELALAMKEKVVDGLVATKGAYLEDMFVVVDGMLRYGTGEVGPGNVFGAYHGFGEAALTHDLVATAGTRVLALPVEVLLDLAEDDVFLAVSWLRGLAARLLEVLPDDHGAALLEARRG